MIKLWDSIDKHKGKRGRKTTRQDVLARGYLWSIHKDPFSFILIYHFSSKHGSKLHTHPLLSIQRWLNSHSTTIRKYRVRNKR